MTERRPDGSVQQDGSLDRPTTDTRLITELDVTDAAQAIRSALERAGGAAGAGGAEPAVRLADLEERFARIEAAIDDLSSRLDREE